MTKISAYFSHEVHKVEHLGLHHIHFYLVLGDFRRLWIGTTLVDKTDDEAESYGSNRCIDIYNDWMAAGGTVPSYEMAVDPELG